MIAPFGRLASSTNRGAGWRSRGRLFREIRRAVPFVRNASVLRQAVSFFVTAAMRSWLLRVCRLRTLARRAVATRRSFASAWTDPAGIRTATAIGTGRTPSGMGPVAATSNASSPPWPRAWSCRPSWNDSSSRSYTHRGRRSGPGKAVRSLPVFPVRAQVMQAILSGCFSRQRDWAMRNKNPFFHLQKRHLGLYSAYVPSFINFYFCGRKYSVSSITGGMP